MDAPGLGAYPVEDAVGMAGDVGQLPDQIGQRVVGHVLQFRAASAWQDLVAQVKGLHASVDEGHLEKDAVYPTG